jgi:hypothetical protein
LLKPAHTAIELRRLVDLGREELDEPPLAEADLPGEVANHYRRVSVRRMLTLS